MDGSKIDLLKEAAVRRCGDARTLAQSKQSLRQAASALDPLAPLRRHPAVTVIAAAALGAAAAVPAVTERTWRLANSELIHDAIKLLSAAIKNYADLQYADAPALASMSETP